VDEVFPRAGRPGPYEGITAAGVNPRPTAVSINLSLPSVSLRTPAPLPEGGGTAGAGGSYAHGRRELPQLRCRSAAPSQRGPSKLAHASYDGNPMIHL